MKKIGKLGISLLIAIMLMVTTLPSASISANSENLIKNTGFTVQKDGSGNYNPTDWTVGYTSNRLLDGWYTDYNTNQWEEQFKPVETEAGLSLRVWMRENIRKAEARGNTMTQNLSGLEVGHMYSLTGTISSISTDVSGASYGSIEIHDASGNIVSSIRLDLKPNEAGTSITDTTNFTYTGGTYKLVLRSYSYSGTMEQTINYTGLNLVPTVGENIVVKYVDENNTEISDTELISGFVGETYSTSEKTIENYTLIEVPSNATGTIKQEIQNVIYRYRLNDGAAVTVKYIDTEGNELASSEILTGQLTKPYTSQVKDIADYEVVTTPDNAEGVFTKDAQEVVYVYDLVQGADVTVKYVDTEGNSISDDLIISGKLNSKYQTKAEVIENYTLVKLPDNENGIFTHNEQEVIYIYELGDAENVVVHYVDKNGTKLQESILLSGKLTTAYTTRALEIENYYLLSTPYNAKGTFSSSIQEVTYVYDLVQGENVTVKYVDTDGNELATSDILTGQLTKPYTSQAKEITNYKLIKTPENAEGVFTEETQEVTYVYEKLPTETTPVLPNTGQGNQLMIGSTIVFLLGMGLVLISKKEKRQ